MQPGHVTHVLPDRVAFQKKHQSSTRTQEIQARSAPPTAGRPAAEFEARGSMPFGAGFTTAITCGDGAPTPFIWRWSDLIEDAGTTNVSFARRRTMKSTIAREGRRQAFAHIAENTRMART